MYMYIHNRFYPKCRSLANVHPINNVIPPHIMNESSTTVEGQITDAINILSDDLYPCIGETERNFLTH